MPSEFVDELGASVISRLLSLMQELEEPYRLALSPFKDLLPELRNVLEGFLDKDGHLPLHAYEFRNQLHRFMTLIIQRITDADCVFVRRLNTDGSVELAGQPVWHRETHGFPPHVKPKGEGISGCVFNMPDPRPVVVRDIWGQDVSEEYRAAHQKGLSNYQAGTPECEFAHFIRAETCVPFSVKGKILGGIVAARGTPYEPEHATRIERVLRTWHEVITALYYVGLKLQMHDELETCMKTIVHAIPSITATPSDDVFLQKVLTVLTSHCALGWHRAMIFLFEHAYPSAARCLMAVGGTCEPSWSEVQATLAADCTSLDEHLLLAEEPDYGHDDPLFHLVRKEPFVIAEDFLLRHDLLNELFSASAQTNLRYLIEDGVVPLAPEDPWLAAIPRAGEFFPEAARRCHHYLVPLLCAEGPDAHRGAENRYHAIGFVLADSPYTHWVEHNNHTALTRLVCDLFAPYIGARRGRPSESQRSRAPELEWLLGRDRDLLLRSLPEEVVQKLERAYRDLGEGLQTEMYKMLTSERPPRKVAELLHQLNLRRKRWGNDSIDELQEPARTFE